MVCEVRVCLQRLKLIDGTFVMLVSRMMQPTDVLVERMSPVRDLSPDLAEKTGGQGEIRFRSNLRRPNGWL
jgi:hypothetical protein